MFYNIQKEEMIQLCFFLFCFFLVGQFVVVSHGETLEKKAAQCFPCLMTSQLHFFTVPQISAFMQKYIQINMFYLIEGSFTFTSSAGKNILKLLPQKPLRGRVSGREIMNCTHHFFQF